MCSVAKLTQLLTRPLTRRLATALSASFGTGGGSGGGAPAMPAGAVGIWYMDEYQSAPRPYIPNAVAGTPLVNNLFTGSRGLFASSKSFWFQTAATVTDDAAAGPDGAPFAATVAASGTGWNLSRTLSLPAGTYTLAVNVKRGGASDETFKLAAGATTGGVQTATSVWQRFSLTFTHAGGVCQVFLLNNATIVSLVIDNFELFMGAADLGPETLAGHMYLGVDAYTRKGSYADGILDLTTIGTQATALFPSEPDFTAGVTMVGLFSKTSADSGYVSLLSKPGQYQTFGGWIERNNLPMFTYGANATYAESYTEYWDFLNKGWHTIANRYDPVGPERSTWLDGGKLFRQAATVAAQSVRNFMLSNIDGGGTYGGGYKFAGGVALFNRALTDDEIRQAETHLLVRALTAASVSRSPIRVLVAEGDSITQGTAQYVSQFKTNQNPSNIGQIDAIGGATLADVANRLPQIRLIKPATTEPGSKYIFSIMVTNSVGLLTAAQYLADLKAICSIMRSDGWIVAVGTITPRSDGSFNTKRNTINADIRTWVGTYCDAIFDFAADPTIGTDAAGANATYYPDGVHPTASVQSTYMEPIYRAAINAIT